MTLTDKDYQLLNSKIFVNFVVMKIVIILNTVIHYLIFSPLSMKILYK